MTEKLTTAVVLCTYNGERFLEEQLNSLAVQTRQPDEVIICDDCSSDNSVHIAKIWANKVSFRVIIHENEKNLGFSKNFQFAMSLASADVLFLCDQDDYWMTDKIEKITQVFEEHPQTGLVYSDSLVRLEQEDRILDTQIIQLMRFYHENSLPSFTCRYVPKNQVTTGCCGAIRKSLADRIPPVPKGWFHDAWFYAVGQLMMDIETLTEPLIIRRYHGGNTSNDLRNTINRKIAPYSKTEDYWLVYERIVQFEAFLVQFKEQFPENKRIRRTLTFVRSCHRHFRNRYRIRRNLLFFFPLWLFEVVSGAYFVRYYPFRAMMYDFTQGLQVISHPRILMEDMAKVWGRIFRRQHHKQDF